MALIPVKEGLLTAPLEQVDEVRLRGSRCRSCAEVFLGEMVACDNCMSTDMESVVLGKRGRLFSFTTVWHPLPGSHRGPEPFQPYSIGFVEMPEGVRILSPLVGRDADQYTIGADLEFVARRLCTNAGGDDVIAYAFRQVGDGEKPS